MTLYSVRVTAGLKRYYLKGSLHFITFSCYRRQQHLVTASRRNLVLRVLEHARRRYGFALLGYVFMPEHIHLLMTMPAIRDGGLLMSLSSGLQAESARAGLCIICETK